MASGSERSRAIAEEQPACLKQREAASGIAYDFGVRGLELGRADIKFKVYAQEVLSRRTDEQLIGTLLVSHGAIEWRSRKKQHKVKLSWADFDRYMLDKRSKH